MKFYAHLLAIVTITYILLPSTYAQDKVFQLFDNNGNMISFDNMMKSALEKDIFLFGEYHDQPICHWLQKEILFYLSEKKGGNLKVGMEMFESDDQLLIDEYFKGLINQNKFEAEARLWKNYKTDYKDILEFSKEKNIPLFGTNVPGRYANLVYREGIEKLNELSSVGKSYMPPLPIEIDLTIPSYARLLDMGGGGHSPSGKNFPHAQALRDATMAFHIYKNMDNDSYFYHLNGAYHSDDYEGINYFLLKTKPALKIFTLSTVYQENLDHLEEEYFTKADVILVVKSTMTKSH